MNKALPILALLAFSLIPSSLFAQEKFEQLRIELTPLTQEAFGGEEFRFRINVRNDSDREVKNLTLRFSDVFGKIKSIEPSKDCVVSDQRRAVPRCQFDSIPAFSSLEMESLIQLREFGDRSKPKNRSDEQRISEKEVKFNRRLIEMLARSQPLSQDRSTVFGAGRTVLIIDSFFEIEGKGFNSRSVFRNPIEPSKNIPPRMRITSHKNEAIVLKRYGETLNLKVIFEAFDLDGTINELKVLSPYIIQNLWTDPRIRVWDLNERLKIADEITKENLLPVRSIGNNRYEANIPITRFGPHQISFGVLDNGGRGASASLKVMVRLDGKLKIDSSSLNRSLPVGRDVAFLLSVETNDQHSGNVQCVVNRSRPIQLTPIKETGMKSAPKFRTTLKQDVPGRAYVRCYLLSEKEVPALEVETNLFFGGTWDMALRNVCKKGAETRELAVSGSIGSNDYYKREFLGNLRIRFFVNEKLVRTHSQFSKEEFVVPIPDEFDEKEGNLEARLVYRGHNEEYLIKSVVPECKY